MVRNGGTAAIATFTEIPFPQAKVTVTNVSSTNISFKPVGITLGIKPIIAGTETVILQIHADVSAVTGFAATDPIDTPIVSKRTAVTSVHVPNGKSTIIGGLRTTASIQNETKIPILGDIPILGYLFRSTTDQSSETTLSFIITPRIRIGSQDVLAR
jgi:general secretion pathway protein D